MKRLGMLLVLVSVSMFVFGCAETKKKEAKPGTTVEKKEGGAGAPAAEPTPEEKK